MQLVKARIGTVLTDQGGYAECSVIEPAADPRAYKTYEIRQELYEVPCAEAFCPDFMLGFVSEIDPTTELGQAQAHFIRGDKTRAHVEEQISANVVRFTFPPGTKCFAPPDRRRHTKPRDGEQQLIERGGDWRGNPTGHFIDHTRAEFFLESWEENQSRLADLIQRG